MALELSVRIVETVEEALGGEPAHLLAVLIDHGDGGLERRRGGEVAEADDRHALRRNACSADTTDTVHRALDENTAVGGSGSARMRRRAAAAATTVTAPPKASRE